MGPSLGFRRRRKRRCGGAGPACPRFGEGCRCHAVAGAPSATRTSASAVAGEARRKMLTRRARAALGPIPRPVFPLGGGAPHQDSECAVAALGAFGRRRARPARHAAGGGRPATALQRGAAKCKLSKRRWAVSVRRLALLQTRGKHNGPSALTCQSAIGWWNMFPNWLPASVALLFCARFGIAANSKTTLQFLSNRFCFVSHRNGRLAGLKMPTQVSNDQAVGRLDEKSHAPATQKAPWNSPKRQKEQPKRGRGTHRGSSRPSAQIAPTQKTTTRGPTPAQRDEE
jgi:hypothetical protein